MFDCKYVAGQPYLKVAMEEKCFVGRHFTMMVSLGFSQLFLYVSVLCLILLFNGVESTEASNLVDEVLRQGDVVTHESVRDLISLNGEKRSLLNKRGSRRKLCKTFSQISCMYSTRQQHHGSF